MDGIMISKLTHGEDRTGSVTLHTPDGDVKFRDFILVGVITHEEDTEVSAITQCRPIDLIRSLDILHSAAKQMINELNSSNDPSDIVTLIEIRAELERMMRSWE